MKKKGFYSQQLFINIFSSLFFNFLCISHVIYDKEINQSDLKVNNRKTNVCSTI